MGEAGKSEKKIDFNFYILCGIATRGDVLPYMGYKGMCAKRV